MAQKGLRKSNYSVGFFVSSFFFFPKVGAVCVGFDEYFNLNKIAQAMRYLQDESTPFIATNTDYSYPVGGGVFTPGKYTSWIKVKAFASENSYRNTHIFSVRSN